MALGWKDPPNARRHPHPPLPKLLELIPLAPPPPPSPSEWPLDGPRRCKGPTLGACRTSTQRPL